eukprot:gnl/MRDRNA2_/MRDRNA2_71306_c0_seq2.p1 gnl/MRDRNA2_/MRDRNA2_71306_c0~~gnl/MRDRNA2_/MRDRNA2_71306_c0_seq2.p1  ORF type:complete len:246 (+),score=44.47 gnl/MRDRNA2_/MRDRNA2_71306_c0_seq2:113-850(+)
MPLSEDAKLVTVKVKHNQSKGASLDQPSANTTSDPNEHNSMLQSEDAKLVKVKERADTTREDSMITLKSPMTEPRSVQWGGRCDAVEDCQVNRLVISMTVENPPPRSELKLKVENIMKDPTMKAAHGYDQVWVTFGRDGTLNVKLEFAINVNLESFMALADAALLMENPWIAEELTEGLNKGAGAVQVKAKGEPRYDSHLMTCVFGHCLKLAASIPRGDPCVDRYECESPRCVDLEGNGQTKCAL